MNSKLGKLFQGFSKLSYLERVERIRSSGLLTAGELEQLRDGVGDLSLAEKFIENVLGYFDLPLGVATHFCIDGRDYLIPMAVEETSIIAAASKTAKWVKDSGQIVTSSLGCEIIGQIQIAKVKNLQQLEAKVNQHKAYLVELANREVCASMVARGGGVTGLELRSIARPDGKMMAVIHVRMDCREAMGANAMNQVCEYLKMPIEELTGEVVSMCILSNLVDTKLTKVEVELRGAEPELSEKIEEASLFAELDPYRAATNNKGVLNGIDPILIATGNDWRAVEAGIHAYACRDGRYRSITKWWRDGATLKGQMVAPIIVGTVGGVTSLHPVAKVCMKLLGQPSSQRLSQIAGAVGLVQNLGALRALTTVGIIEGHMRLHIKNLSLGAGASDSEMPAMIQKLEDFLKANKRVTLSNAVQVLQELRATQ